MRKRMLMKMLFKDSMVIVIMVLICPFLPTLTFKFLDYVIGDSYSSIKIVFSFVSVVALLALMMKLTTMMLSRVIYSLSKLLEEIPDPCESIDIRERKSSNIENHSWLCSTITVLVIMVVILVKMMVLGEIG